MSTTNPTVPQPPSALQSKAPANCPICSRAIAEHSGTQLKQHDEIWQSVLRKFRPKRSARPSLREVTR